MENRCTDCDKPLDDNAFQGLCPECFSNRCDWECHEYMIEKENSL